MIRCRCLKYFYTKRYRWTDHGGREVAVRTEHPRFFEHGGAETYRKGLERLRKEYGESERSK